METVPDDVLVEILVRVADAVALFHCAVTCKRWRGLAADWPKGARRPSSLIGFFQGQPEPFIIHPPPVLSPFIPAPMSPLGPRRRFLVVSIPEAGSSMERAVPLASRSGLVLVRLGSQEWTGMNSMVHLAVCNPLAGTSQLLPPLEPSRPFSDKSCCCAILSGEDYCSDEQKRSTVGSSTFFKVLIINIIEWNGHSIYLRTFSSTEPSWSAPRKCKNPVVGKQQTHFSAVVCRGQARWLFRNRLDICTLDVNVGTGDVSTTKILLPMYLRVCELYDEPRLGATTDRRLSLNFLHRACLRVEIWTSEGDEDSIHGTAKWLPDRVIELQQPHKTQIDNARCMCVGEKSGTLLIKDSRGNMYVADLETGTMEEVAARLCDPVSTAIPFEIDWPGFFVSPLATGSIKCTKSGEAVLGLARSFG
jgi:hypothetical protein